MTDNDQTPEQGQASDEQSEQPEPAEQQSRRGSVRHQDAESTTPREPSLAEQRARRKALREQKERQAAEQQVQADAERKAQTKRKVLIGSGVTVGLAGLVASWYLVAQPDQVTATCTDDSGTVVPDQYCDEGYVRNQGGHTGGGGLLFLPIGGFGTGTYHYNYGGTGAVGSKVSGGSYTKPNNANVSTKTGKSVQRGGFGISGKSGIGKGGFGT